jgi:hypothetical protein
MDEHIGSALLLHREVGPQTKIEVLIRSGKLSSRLNQNAAVLEIVFSGLKGLCYRTVKATTPTVALTEPDVPVTVIV